jgi:hypothetical protein
MRVSGQTYSPIVMICQEDGGGVGKLTMRHGLAREVKIQTLIAIVQSQYRL